MNVRMERTMEKLLYELSLSFELPLCSSLFLLFPDGLHLVIISTRYFFCNEVKKSINTNKILG